MSETIKSTGLVTGASSGIGAVLHGVWQHKDMT